MSGRIVFDEMQSGSDGIRPVYSEVATWFAKAPKELISSRKAEAEAFFRRIGITFADYGLGPRICLHKGDLFAPIAGKAYDLILTNPPYVDRTTMDMLPVEFRHEPVMALAGGEDGFEIVRRILKSARAHLNEGGAILCEIGLEREVLDTEFPDTPFYWLDTEASQGEVFWLLRDQLP